jgi:hypothetical protein
MHQNRTDDGPPPPHTATPRLLAAHPDPAPPPRANHDPGPHPEAAHAKTRPARTRYSRFNAEHQAARDALRSADALIADTRALLAQLAAGAFRQTPAAPPRLRIVGGTEWSAQQAQREGNTPTT